MGCLDPSFATPIFQDDFMLTVSAFPGDDGRFQARVAITALGRTRVRGQRFVDSAWFATREEALSHARSVGVDFVRAQVDGRRAPR